MARKRGRKRQHRTPQARKQRPKAPMPLERVQPRLEAPFPVGVVYPLNVGQALDIAVLNALKAATKAQWLRFNVDMQSDQNTANIKRCLDAGFEPFPIMDADYARLNVEADVAYVQEYCEFCSSMMAYPFRAMEFLNEPRTMHGMSPQMYGRVCNAAMGLLRNRMLPEQRPKFIVAAEILKPSRTGPYPFTYRRRSGRRANWFRDLRSNLKTEWIDWYAIHHYRNPAAPSVASIGGTKPSWKFWGQPTGGTRQAEHNYVMQETQGIPVITTEIGNDERPPVGPTLIGKYTYEELNYNRILGVKGCFIYAHLGPYGLLEEGTWTPKPAARTIREFVATL